VAVPPARYLFAHNPAEGNNFIKMIEKETEDYMKAEVSNPQSEGVKVTGITREARLSMRFCESPKKSTPM